MIGSGLAARTEKHHLGKFSKTIDLKEKYKTADYKDVRQRQMMEFLVPILVSDRPKRISVYLVITIFRFFLEERIVS